jgi:dCMP deaminase
MRPTWDEYGMAFAHTAATRAPCVKRKVGAAIFSEDHQLLATGFNGPPRGAPHRDETTCVRIGIPSGERADVVCCAHAESNAIAQAARHGVAIKGATLYVTTSPCAWCARSIVNAGIVRVVREGDYADAYAASVFAESGIVVETLPAAKATPHALAQCDDGRIEAQHQELLAVHAELGEKVQELADIKQEIQKHAPGDGATSEIEVWRSIANNNARAFAAVEARAARLEREIVTSLAAAGILLPTEEPTASGEIPAAIHSLARQLDTATAVVAVHEKEIQALESWAHSKAPLLGGRIARAVLTYAAAHEARCFQRFEQEHAAKGGDDAYQEASNFGARAAIERMTAVLNGPHDRKPPTFSDVELTRFAARLLVLRTALIEKSNGVDTLAKQADDLTDQLEAARSEVRRLQADAIQIGVVNAKALALARSELLALKVATYKRVTTPPNFAPGDGVCWSCHSNVFAHESLSGLAILKTTITGCPWCARSFCD